MENEKLLPCPFCGDIPRMKTNYNYLGEPFYQVRHDCKCFLSMMETFCYKNESEAISAWNIRAPIETEITKKCNHEYQVKKYITHDIDDPKCEVEYSLFCTVCNKYLGTFSYGAWDYSLGQLSDDKIIKFLEGEYHS